MSKWRISPNEWQRQWFGDNITATYSVVRRSAAGGPEYCTGHTWLRRTPYPGYYSGNGAAGAIQESYSADVWLFSAGSTASR